MPPLNRQQVQQLLESGQITRQQHQALVQRINQNIIAGGSAEITPEQANEVVGSVGGEDQGFGPGFIRPFTRSSFEIPLPGTEASIGVNAPLLGIGATLATLGIGAPAAAGTAAGGIAARQILPGLVTRGVGQRAAGAAGRVVPAGARQISRGRVAGATALGSATFLGGGIVGTEQQPPVTPALPPGDTTPTDGDAAARAQAALGPGPQAPQLPGEGGPGDNVPIRVPIRDEQGNETGQFVTMLNGEVIDVDPGGVLTDQERFNLETAEKQRQERLAGMQAGLRRGEARSAAGLQATQLREEQARQRMFQEEQSRLNRQSQLVQSLLPILASPGNRFRFAANVSRLQGGGAQFEPTGAFSELFRIAGSQPGSNISLTGQQDFSIIPNIQQLAGLSGFERDELGAITGELSGQTLRQVERQSRRLAPPGGGGPRAIIGR